MKTLIRIIKNGFKNFYRNKVLSIASILIITITLLAGASVYFAGNMMNASFRQIEGKVDINIYMRPVAEENDIINLKKDIENLKELDDGKIIYKTKEQVLEEFKNREQKKETSTALNILDDNPFGAVINIAAKDSSVYKKVDEFVYSDEIKGRYGDIIESTSYKNLEGVISKLKFLINFFNSAGYILSIFLAFIAFLVTYNTLRLVLHSKKEEIEVMRLVGASSVFAKGPFVFSGVIYGFVAGVITNTVLFFGVKKASSFLNEAFVFNIYEFYSENMFLIIGTLLLSGMTIGFTSSYLAVMRYIKI